MSVNANEVDILNLRTTNINIRISPMLKLKIIESGARMGINISDYINYVLTKTMAGQMDVENTPEYKALEEAYETLETKKEELQQKVTVIGRHHELLQQQVQRVNAELSKYEAVVEPYKNDVGKQITINGETFQPNHPADLMNFILEQFKVKR